MDEDDAYSVAVVTAAVMHVRVSVKARTVE